MSPGNEAIGLRAKRQSARSKRQWDKRRQLRFSRFDSAHFERLCEPVWSIFWCTLVYFFDTRFTSSFIFFQNHFWWILTFPGQAKIGISCGGYCKNQSFALFATDCLWEFIFERFWLQIGNNFGLPLEPGCGFESSRHKVDFWKQVGVKWLPAPPPNLQDFSPAGGGSGGGSLTRFIPLRLKPTGSADFKQPSASLRGEKDYRTP